MSPRESTSPLPLIETLALAALADEPLYGYELALRIERITEGRVRVRPGNLYRVLHRLEERGLVRETSAGRGAVDERRIYFATTREGRRALAREKALLARVIRGSDLAGEAGADV